MKNKRNIALILLLISTYLLPYFGSYYMATMAVTLVVALFVGKFSNIKTTLKALPYFYVFLVLMGLNFIGFYFSSNKTLAAYDLEINQWFVSTAFIFMLIRPTKKELLFIGKILIAACLAASVICLLIALFKYNIIPINRKMSTAYEYFIYSRLSIFKHPSYFALLINTACVLLIELYFSVNTNKKSKVLYASLFFFFSIFTLLLSSKMGLFAYLISVLFLIYKLLKNKVNLKFIGILVLLLPLTFCALYASVTQFKTRVDGAFKFNIDASDYDKSNSSAVRLLVWDVALELIEQKPLRGWGNGDTKSELIKQYQIKDYAKPLARKMNIHNQFLQNFVEMGILGFLVTLFIVAWPIWFFIKKKDGAAAIIMIIITLHLCVESMLELQAGNKIISFLIVFLLMRYAIKQNTIDTKISYS